MGNKGAKALVQQKIKYPRQSVSRKVLAALFIVVVATRNGWSQTKPELVTAMIKLGHVWGGVKANGDKGTFSYGSFFPNDYDIVFNRGQDLDAWAGSGLRLAATNWYGPDSLHKVAVYGPTNEYQSDGRVVRSLTNYVRHNYPLQTIDFKTVDMPLFGTYDRSQFGAETYDQIVEVTSYNVLGVNIHRKILAWSQNLNDDYLIVDLEFENVGDSTLTDFYINMQSNGANTFRSYALYPAPPSSEAFKPAVTWQHYYGGRIGDTLRVFYEYSADDPTTAGDNMGAPVASQGGRLVGAKFYWYSILHASGAPYSDPAQDQDDFIQPRVTYIGTATKIPYNSANDEFGDKNYWAIRGAWSRYWPMTGDTLSGTFHGGNSDETGDPDYSNYPAGTKSSTNSKMTCSFGPYTFRAGQKIHIVYATGYSGLGPETAATVGKKWLAGTLTDPPNLPHPRTGYFPANFAFPLNATEMDLRKDRWLSTGIDSVMQSARRAKWNYAVGYKIPQAPPPPATIELTAWGTGVEVKWTNPEAENLPNFAGYRILRRLSALDTVFYQVVYDSSPEDKAEQHLFRDRTGIYGALYFYYLQTKARIAPDDALADPTSRGKIIYSSRVLIPNLYSIKPVALMQDDMSKIRIVPNPYNINDPLLTEQGWTDQRGLVFYNLPAKVTIKIFTENGDLVRVIEHDSPVLAGSEYWDMLTRSQQVISSGVYLAVFQKPDGETAFQKFLVIR